MNDVDRRRAEYLSHQDYGFPTPLQPLYVPAYAVERLSASNDPALASWRQALKDGAIVAVKPLEPARSGVTPGGIVWQG